MYIENNMSNDNHIPRKRSESDPKLEFIWHSSPQVLFNIAKRY